MAIYTYEAKNLEGNVINGEIEADSKEAVIVALRGRHYFPNEIKEKIETNVSDLASFDKVTIKDLSLFCRQFAFILESGISMVKAVELCREQSPSKKMKEILARVSEKIQKGRSISEALRVEEEIPELMINMFEAGEASGKLEKIVADLATYYNKAYKQEQKIKSALIYPKIVIGFAIVVVLGLMYFVVPQFIETIIQGGGNIPLPTQILMAMSSFLTDNIILIALVIISLIVVKKAILDKDRKFLYEMSKWQVNKSPFKEINRQIIAGRFASTFSILVSSGLGIIKALEIAGSVCGNDYIEDELEVAKEDVKKGNPIGKTVEDMNILPKMLTQMITVGEESGQLEEILEKTSAYYEDEVEMATQKLVSMVEPMIIIVLAVVVLGIVLSLLLPIFEMTSAVQGMG